jgi:hypothetical protein
MTIPSRRAADRVLDPPRRVWQRFQIEVPADLGRTLHSVPMFQSFLPHDDVADVYVHGGTLTYEIEVR